MALPYHPKPGTIVVCDYSTGFRPPEMVKQRLAIIISPKLKRRNDLASVVPLSATCPTTLEEWHHRLDISLPPPWGDCPRWAACDHIATVAYHRLNLPYTKHPVTGSRQFIQRELEADILKELRRKVALALGIAG
ncbi:type II toxin-antitoxin system PemK/MazF family toxin [Sandaracinobacteroides hominis]|uniref:type II toxin-antitoxin system PemK/MazF family toxin n=1 Tax=Sandaracinobacteroides hominis TaxID=2780086 RepID=UPI0018F42DC4|nr:type II toxin-antitoxin system PemK/MazF family toxin [Sandaracinobacteroides hominis]